MSESLLFVIFAQFTGQKTGCFKDCSFLSLNKLFVYNEMLLEMFGPHCALGTRLAEIFSARLGLLLSSVHCFEKLVVFEASLYYFISDKARE